MKADGDLHLEANSKPKNAGVQTTSEQNGQNCRMRPHSLNVLQIMCFIALA